MKQEKMKVWVLALGRALFEGEEAMNTARRTRCFELNVMLLSFSFLTVLAPKVYAIQGHAGYDLYGKIAQVSGQSIIANSTTDSNDRISFTLPNLPQQPIAGQNVWVNAVTNQVKFVKFPIAAERSDDIDVGHMNTKVVVSNNGTVQVTTRTWTNNAANGFVGAVMVVLSDEQGNEQFHSEIKKYGVNSKSAHDLGGGPNDRTEIWYPSVADYPVSPDKLGKVSKIAITHIKSSKSGLDNLNEALAYAKTIAAFVDTAVETYNKFKSAGAGGGTTTPGGGGTTDTGGVTGAPQTTVAPQSPPLATPEGLPGRKTPIAPGLK